MSLKRRIDGIVPVMESPKLIKGGEDEERLPVGKHGTVEQIRAASTATVSPDATRFVPRQIRIKNQKDLHS
jgi:hypothetical protein